MHPRTRPLVPWLLALCPFAGPAGAADPSGDAVIRARAGKSDIVITTTARLAGAIHSLTWDGVEFIDSTDHGRQLQSAANFDVGKPFFPETFNPTEAGSCADSAGPTSSSRLISLRATGNELETTTRMAFWLKPGETSGGHPAANTTILSDHSLKKCVRIGRQGLPHAIDYDVTFTVPTGEHHTYAQFEAVTGYMPVAFSRFLGLAADGTLVDLDRGQGEQALPIILSTPSGSHAMGVYSPDQPSRGFETVGYGRFRFGPEKVNKWNCVFRVRDPKGVPAGDYQYHMVVAVGAREDVVATMSKIRGEGLPRR